jgi:hypothetical protein
MKDNYKEWILQQDLGLIIEIHGVNKDITRFKNRLLKSCSLNELEALDNKFIFNVAEPQKPGGQNER